MVHHHHHLLACRRSSLRPLFHPFEGSMRNHPIQERTILTSIDADEHKTVERFTAPRQRSGFPFNICAIAEVLIHFCKLARVDCLSLVAIVTVEIKGISGTHIVVPGDDKRPDACLFQFIQFLHYILMTQQLAIFRQVAGDQEKVRFLFQGDGNDLVEDCTTVIIEFTIEKVGTIEGLAFVDEQSGSHHMRVGDQHDAHLCTDRSQCQKECQSQQHSSYPTYIIIISSHFRVQRYE